MHHMVAPLSNISSITLKYILKYDIKMCILEYDIKISSAFF